MQIVNKIFRVTVRLLIYFCHQLLPALKKNVETVNDLVPESRGQAADPQD